jgi:hypothetical protein
MFGVKYCLHLQGISENQENNNQKSKAANRMFLLVVAFILFDSEDGDSTVLRKFLSFYLSTRHRIPEDDIYENLKSNIYSENPLEALNSNLGRDTGYPNSGALVFSVPG